MKNLEKSRVIWNKNTNTKFFFFFVLEKLHAVTHNLPLKKYKYKIINMKDTTWINAYVRAIGRNCNHLRQAISQNWQEWIDACCKANQAINKAKSNG